MNNTLVTRLLSTHAGYSALLLRIPVGIIFMAHGAQKLFGAYGGAGLQGAAAWMESMGLSPGLLMALLAGAAELFGGLALCLGLLTRPAAFALGFTMLVAIFTVHVEHGLFMSNNGYEFALALLAACISLLLSGAGKFSLDARFARTLR